MSLSFSTQSLAQREKQIEQINDRLSGIEDALRNFKVNNTNVSPVTLPETAASTTTSASDVARSQIATPTAFEGASSFTSQAIVASQAAGISLASIQGSEEVVDALKSLNNLGRTPGGAGIQQDMRLGSSTTPRSLPEVQLLPAQFVLSLLAQFRNRLSAIFLAYAFRDYKQLERLCQSIYFPTEPVSIASLTLVNGVLYYMIKELIFGGDYGLCKGYDLKAFSEQAERNFHSGVETYEIFAHPSHESVRVLMLAMLKAQEEGKPLLTWTFVSAGARQATSLGYHRESSLKNDSPEVANEKRLVFWTYYIVDKNVSCSIGYSSTLQDYDIDIKYFTISSDPGIRPWDKAMLAMVEIARLQGLIYERLYSQQALNATSEAKFQVINDLSPRLIKWHREWSQVGGESAYLPAFFFLIYGAFDVVYYSVVATMHRAATPSSTSVEITSACYEAAKKSLNAHLHFFPAFKSYGDVEILTSYLAWILLYSSWTPLIVVFLHAIASSSKEDVKLLEETQESLEPLKNLNQQSEQVYGLCKIFCKLAKAFVERNSTFIGSYDSQEDMVVMPQSDMHGRDLNFMTAPSMQFSSQMMGPESQLPSFDVSGMDDMSMFLGNWLGGREPVANLWAMDFTDNTGNFE
ncbi:hypothetical protein PMZ80_006508 [Knufia obscura]|uniref:Xylanolytic transcriptional activator regulatory domain-containing protein n=1 Tax=Knufia obscura TaxID=1635080 RepID=A0ABR0RKV7_9EURO|nr:hypothetical protein PMZ80_006508 [Knufia obscura]